MKIEINITKPDEAVISVGGKIAGVVTIRRDGYDSKMDSTCLTEDSPRKLIAQQFHKPLSGVLKLIQLVEGDDLDEALNELVIEEIRYEID